MKEHVGVVLVIEEEHSVSSGTEFPDVFFEVLGDVLTQPGTMILKQLNILRNLLMLYACVFV